MNILVYVSGIVTLILLVISIVIDYIGNKNRARDIEEQNRKVSLQVINSLHPYSSKYASRKRKRHISKELKKEEHYMLYELLGGNITCSKTQNTDTKYNDKKMVKGMSNFYTKPISSQIMQLKGMPKRQ